MIRRRWSVLFTLALALLSFPSPLAGAAGDALMTITPCRAADTRNPAGPLGGPSLGANVTRIFTLTGACSIPSDALALAVNITVVSPAATGYAQLYAGDAAAPPTSVLSFSAGRTRAGNAVVALASDGSGTVALANVSVGAADFILDITGFFVSTCPPPPPPVITPTPAQVCPGSAGNTASGPAATTWAWTITNGTITSATNTQTITYTAGASGSVGLTLVVTNASTCSAQSSLGVPIDANPATPPITTSNPETFAVLGTSGTFTLTFNGQTTSSLAFDATPAAVQSALNALSSIGGVGGSVTVTESANLFMVTFGGTLSGPQPQLTAAGAGGCTVVVSPPGVCSGSTGNQASGPAGAATYAWSIANGAIIGSTSGQTITYSAGASGNVTLNLTIANGPGCAASNSVQVPINAVPLAPPITTNPQALTISGASGTFTLTFNGQTTSPLAFNAPPAAVQSALNALASIGGVGGSVTVSASAGVDTVTFGGTLSGPQPPLTASGAGGCTVTVGPAPVCADATANEAGGPAGATTYLWSITNGTITSANNIQNIVFTAGPSGAATLHLTVTNANNCPASNSLDVPINPAPATPTITPTPATVCAGSTGNTADGPAGATTYAWTITNGTITSLTNIQTITYTAGPSGNVTLSLTVTNASGCSAASAPTDVPISAIPTLAPADGSIFNGTFNTAGFSQAFTASPAGTYTYAINPVTPPAGLGFNTSTGLLSGTPNATGTFGFTVKATNAAGCSITQSYSVKIAPNLTAKSYTDVGNTQLVGGVVAPATPSVSVVAVSNGDTSDTTITYAVTVGPTHGALTTFNSTGTFLYTPNAGNTTSDAFTYTGTSNGVSATQTATIAFSGMVWYVDNATLSGTNDGRSNTPFKTMTAVNGAATASGDFIYVAAGSGPTTGAYTMKPGQQLIGAEATLNAGGGILIIPGVAANTPTLSGTLTLSSSVVVNGLDMSTGSSRAITNFNGASYGTVTGVSVTARSVTSTTGTAVDIQGTGNTGTMTFKSVSASGGSNGIVLSNFTGGSFTVNGDGANTSVGGNASGGTISGMSGGDGGVAGSGVYLNNATNVTLRRVTINGTNTNFGIRGFQVNGFTLEYSTVGGTNGTNHNTLPDDSGEGSIYFGNSVTNGLSTQGTFTNNNISGGAWDNMHIENTTAGTTTITVKGNTFGLNGTTTGNQSLIIEARNAGTIINSVVGGPGAGEPNTFLGAPGGLANFTGQTGTTMDVQFKNNVMSNSHPNNNIGGGCLTVASQGIMTFVVDGNSMRDADGSTMTLQKASLGTSFTGRVTNNTLGVTGVLKSASKSGNGIFLSAAGAGTIGLTITGNSILNWNGNAAMFFDNTGGSYTANFTITGNTLAEPGAGSFATLALTNGGNTTSDTVNVCAVIGGAGALKNTISGAAGLADVYLGSSGQNGGHTFNLPGYVGVSNLANVQTFVTGNNTLSSGATVIAYDDNGGEGSFTGTGTSCPTP